MAEADSEKLLETLDKSSSRNGRQLVVYLSVQVYFLVMVASTTDLQLLWTDSKIRLPILGVELPLFGFYVVAPALLLILHFNLLLHLLHHARKLKAWNEATTTEEQEQFLPGFILNYTVPFREKTLNQMLMRTLQVIVLCVFPLLMLLYFQIRFADYHSIWMTGWHFLLVVFDVFVLIVYWYRINCPEYLDSKYDAVRQLLKAMWREHMPAQGSRKRLFGVLRRRVTGYSLLFVGAITASAFCLAIVVLICGDFFMLPQPRDRRYERQPWYITYLPRLSLYGEQLVKAPSDVIIQAFLNNGKGVDTAWAHYAEGINLEGRDLRLAVLINVNLFNANLNSAVLNGANLRAATMNGAQLVYAECNNADLSEANLRNAYLFRSTLNGASLMLSDLTNAHVAYADLDNSDLFLAKLDGAYLAHAQINGSDLTNAFLNRTDLDSVAMNGAILSDAQLNGANLTYAQLNGAVLANARLDGSRMCFAEFNGADFTKALLNGVDLSGAQLFGAELTGAQVSGGHLNQSKLRGCRNMLATEVYIGDGIDTTLPCSGHWDSLGSKAELITDSLARENFLKRLDSALIWSRRLDSTMGVLASDLSGFRQVRKAIACRNSWAAVGMLWQSRFSDTWIPDIGWLMPSDTLLEAIYNSCPDSIEVLRSRATRPFDISGTIDAFLQQKKGQGKQ